MSNTCYHVPGICEQPVLGPVDVPLLEGERVVRKVVGVGFRGNDAVDPRKVVPHPYKHALVVAQLAFVLAC